GRAIQHCSPPHRRRRRSSSICSTTAFTPTWPCRARRWRRATTPWRGRCGPCRRATGCGSAGATPSSMSSRGRSAAACPTGRGPSSSPAAIRPWSCWTPIRPILRCFPKRRGRRCACRPRASPPCAHGWRIRCGWMRAGR
ncbi:hypothetical protein LTR94_033304, partial [Friedmanniomyces endolithicus]